MKHPMTLILFFVAIMIIALKPSHSNNEKIKYCHIVAIATIQKESYSPELINEYWTDCNMSFSSKKEYNIGDSIPIKTIIITEE